MSTIISLNLESVYVQYLLKRNDLTPGQQNVPKTVQYSLYYLPEIWSLKYHLKAHFLSVSTQLH